MRERGRGETERQRKRDIGLLALSGP